MTPRQRQALQLLADGHSRAEAARRMGLRPAGFAGVLRGAYAALGARSLTQALVRAWRAGAIRVAEPREEGAPA